MTPRTWRHGQARGLAPPCSRRRGRADPRLDVFGLAATIYELCTGERPERGSYRPIHPSAPPELDAVLAEALALDVEARTPTVAALLAGLRRIQSGRERLLDGRYELLRPLGVGGRAEVMLAHHRLAGRDVALKRLHAGRQTEEERARLRREARVLAELRHPAFPSLYDVHEHDGQLYLAMEFMQGERAGNLVQQPLCPAHVLAVGIQLADALVALHSLGVNELAHALLAALHPDPLHRFDAPGLLARLTEAAELQAAEDRGPEPS